MLQLIFALSKRLMHKPGFAGSPQRLSADALAAGLALLASGAAVAQSEELRPYKIVGDAIPAALTGTAGDAARGRAIVLDRKLGACLLCHTVPFP